MVYKGAWKWAGRPSPYNIEIRIHIFYYTERKIWLRMCRGLINQTPTGLRNNLIRSV